MFQYTCYYKIKTYIISMWLNYNIILLLYYLITNYTIVIMICILPIIYLFNIVHCYCTYRIVDKLKYYYDPKYYTIDYDQLITSC